MSGKLVLLTTLIIVLVGTLGVAFEVQTVEASGTIYIRANGDVKGTDKIDRVGEYGYIFTDNINDSIVIERDNIVVDGAGYTLQGTGSGAGILLSSRSNVAIKNMKITEFNDGIRLEKSSNNSISGNNLTANLVDGFQLINSSSNRIYGNNITNNDDYGIWLWAGSNNNSIYENNITDNRFGIWLELMSFYNSISGNNIINNDEGIRLLESFYNIISGNNITGNKYGIKLVDSSNNIIYHNNFIDNELAQTDTVDSINNVWDDGCPFGGNYWSDYTGVDADHDGIGDSYYIMDANNTDHFPLMGEFHKYHIWYIEPEFTLTLISNSTISNFVVGFWIEHPKYRQIYFNVAGETGYGFCRLCIPKNLMAPPYTVTIDNGQTPVTYYNETLFDNSTHRWIYFAYLHSEHQVIIIAEFPSFLILPLLMIASFLAVIIYKRKHTI